MPIFTAIAGAFAAVSSFIGGLGAIGSFVLKTAVGIGLNLLAKAIAGKPEGPKFEIKGKIQGGGDVPRSFALGWAATAGSLVYQNEGGQAGKTPNAYTTRVIALFDLPVGELVQVMINGQYVTLGDMPDPDMGYPVLEYRKGGKDFQWVKFYDGTQTVADPFLVSKVSSVDRPYEDTRVGTGVAYAICTSLLDQELYTGFPEYKFSVNGTKWYDPSKDNTVGGAGSHRRNDPATWGGDGDHFPAVQIYNLLLGISFGGQWFYGLQNTAPARVPVANFIAQIAKCRASIAGPDGDQPTYRTGGEIPVSSPVADTITALLTGCQGRLAEFGGTYDLHVGAPAEPSFSISDDDILSSEEQSFTPFYGLSDTINGIAAKCPDPAQLWNVKVLPPLYNADYEAEDGNRRLLADVSLDLVPYVAQGQMLQKSALAEARRARRHTYVLPPKFWAKAVPNSTFTWTSARNGYVTKRFRIDGAADKANLDNLVDITEIDPTDFGWDFDTDFHPMPDGPVGPIRPPVQVAVGWTAAPYIIYDASAKARRPTIIVTYPGDLDDVQNIRITVRSKATAAIVSTTTVDYGAVGATGSTKFTVLAAGPYLPDTEYEVEGKLIPFSGRETVATDWLYVKTDNVRLSGDDLAPGSISITEIADNIVPVELLPAVPSNSDPANFKGRLVYDTTNGVTWRFNGTEWERLVLADVLAGDITSAKLADAAVTASKLMNEAVTALKLANDAVTANKIATGAVLEAKLADNAVTVNKILNGAVASAKLATGAVLEEKLADNAVTVSKIGDLAVSAAKLANEAVTNAKLAPLAVDASKIANNAITNTKIDDNAISTPKLQANAVVADKIAANAVLASKLYIADFNNICPDNDMQDTGSWNLSTTPNKHFMAASSDAGNGAIWTSQNVIRCIGSANAYDFTYSTIFPVTAGETLYVQVQLRRTGAGGGSVFSQIQFFDDDQNSNETNVGIGATTSYEVNTFSKNVEVPAAKKFARVRAYKSTLEAAESYIFGGVVVRRAASGELIVEGAITADKVAANAIAAEAIQANAVTTAKVAAGAITANEIATNAVTAAKILSNAVSADKIAANSITATNLVITDFNNMCPDGDLRDPASWLGSPLQLLSKDDAQPADWDGVYIFQKTSPAGDYGFVQSKLFPVNAGETLWLRAQIKRISSGSGPCYVRIVCFDDESLSGQVTANIVSTSNFAPATGNIQYVVPAGKRVARIQAYKQNTTPEGFRFGGVVVRRAASGELIVDGAITAAKVAANAITANEIASNTITSGLIAAGAIGATQIASGAISTDKLAAGAVTAAKIAANSINADKIVAGSIDSPSLALKATIDFDSGSFSYFPTANSGVWVTVASFTLNNIAGNPADLFFEYVISANSTSSTSRAANIRFTRNGTVLSRYTDSVTASGGNSASKSEVATIVDTGAPTGNVTYAAQMMCNGLSANTGGTGSIAARIYKR